MSVATSIDVVSLKDNDVIVDMSPATMITQNILSTNNGRLQSSENSLDGNDASRRCSISPTNLPSSAFRCERCESFETHSHPSFLLHVVQCLSSPSTNRLKNEDNTVENKNENGGSPDCRSIKMTHHDSQVSNNGVIIAAAKGSLNTTTVSSLSSSSSSSTSRKVFECDVCNMKFSNGANMRRHKMRHTGVKPYECRVCQKRFFRKDHLAEHFTTHTKTLPYHCPICNRGFQRQIAMRAHFQNEHVGQHDLVKTCPLCSYRAGSMKSLRIHFFNRHGIDLDNPGASGTSSLLLALESQATQVAAAAVGFVPNLNVVTPITTANEKSPTPNNAITNSNNKIVAHHSDSGESARSIENGTPPMHFLTPHVEISTISESGSEHFNGNIQKEVLEKPKDRDFVIHSPVPQLQEQPLDCNTKSIPSSTSNISVQVASSPKSQNVDNHITPSISLIPIKQEPFGEDLSTDKGKENPEQKHGISSGASSEYGESDYTTPNNRITALIKVSPLKSLLREDLKRRICAKANNRISRNAAAIENNNVIQSTSGVINSSCNSIPICNGTITSTGQETDSTMLNRKQILTCLFCGIEFPDETLYFLHKGCHCDSNPWKCNICGEQCNNVYEFNSHLLSKSHQ